MCSFKKFFILVVLFFGVIQSHASTYVLVHGALFTSSGWAPVMGLLQNSGHNVITVDVPGRPWDSVKPASIDIRVAAEKICQVVRLQSEQVILVGHSQGGAVITQATEFCGEKIGKLVYAAAVLPLDGETAFAGLNPSRDTEFMKCVVVDEGNKIFLLNTQGPLREAFLADVPEPLATLSLNSMVSEPLLIGNSVLKYDQLVFNQIPKYYIEALLDRVVSIETQRELHARVPVQKVFSMNTHHTPFLSQPSQFANILLEIADN